VLGLGAGLFIRADSQPQGKGKNIPPAIDQGRVLGQQEETGSFQQGQGHGALAAPGGEDEEDAPAPVAHAEGVKTVEALFVQVLADGREQEVVGDLMDQITVKAVCLTVRLGAVADGQGPAEIINVADIPGSEADIPGGVEGGRDRGEGVKGRRLQMKVEFQPSLVPIGGEKGKIPPDLFQQVCRKAADPDAQSVEIEEYAFPRADYRSLRWLLNRQSRPVCISRLYINLSVEETRPRLLRRQAG